ncbi:hypothetical protein Ctob_007554 [Chrysochromulina tobinii]|uniref:Uncharacterized protein n=1 Tax=Chrysochromulina tobinii TaxID=1460289 RepID=A0A0M0JBN0_9EUKA|nr:hypothetical protein Ctob_007554 [Chrysochromulina tobinii]|eukprot:KOO23787.1 hypothetical protein Ctob_007554 [Chrysochromulina sp. CCMP291]
MGQCKGEPAATLPDDGCLVRLLELWGPSSTSEESDMKTKRLHMDPTEAPRLQERLRAFRRTLDARDRSSRAGVYKELANKHFAKEAWRVALVGYLAGIWMLREGDPPCPKLLANHLSELVEAAAALGPPLQPPPPERSPPCESVLSVEPLHPTALWRLAKAHEGGNNLSEAIVAASKLARSDASHAEAHRLLDRLQQRTAQYGKMFS